MESANTAHAVAGPGGPGAWRGVAGTVLRTAGERPPTRIQLSVSQKARADRGGPAVRQHVGPHPETHPGSGKSNFRIPNPLFPSPFPVGKQNIPASSPPPRPGPFLSSASARGVPRSRERAGARRAAGVFGVGDSRSRHSWRARPGAHPPEPTSESTYLPPDMLARSWMKALSRFPWAVI